MINDLEREAERLGRQALDGALIALGRQPLDRNPDFLDGDPVTGDIPNVVLHVPGIAPLRFIFGPDLDVWVGPFSELVTIEMSQEKLAFAQQRLEWVLQSAVTYESGRFWKKVSLNRAGAKPWLRLKVRAAGSNARLQPSYAPYSGVGEA